MPSVRHNVVSASCWAARACLAQLINWELEQQHSVVRLIHDYRHVQELIDRNLICL